MSQRRDKCSEPRKKTRAKGIKYTKTKKMPPYPLPLIPSAPKATAKVAQVTERLQASCVTVPLQDPWPISTRQSTGLFFLESLTVGDFWFLTHLTRIFCVLFLGVVHPQNLFSPAATAAKRRMPASQFRLYSSLQTWQKANSGGRE